MYLNQEYLIAKQVLELSNLLISRRNTHIKNLKMTSGQAGALVFYYNFPNSSISDLKRFQHIKHQSAEITTKRLMNKGYVKAITNPSDQRSKIILLTHSGYIKRQQLKQNGSKTGEKILNDFTSSEKREIARLLDKSINNLKGGAK